MRVQLLNDALTFAGAMLLNLLVRHLEAAGASSSSGGLLAQQQKPQQHFDGLAAAANGTDVPPAWAPGGAGASASLLGGWPPGPGSPQWGFLLAALLGASMLAKAVLGSHYSYGLSLVAVRWAR